MSSGSAPWQAKHFAWMMGYTSRRMRVESACWDWPLEQSPTRTQALSARMRDGGDVSMRSDRGVSRRCRGSSSGAGVRAAPRPGTGAATSSIPSHASILLDSLTPHKPRVRWTCRRTRGDHARQEGRIEEAHIRCAVAIAQSRASRRACTVCTPSTRRNGAAARVSGISTAPALNADSARIRQPRLFGCCRGSQGVGSRGTGHDDANRSNVSKPAYVVLVAGVSLTG